MAGLTFEERMAKREERKAALRAEHEEQRKFDLEQLDELELEHGDDQVSGVFTSAGLVVVKVPSPAHYKMFQEAALREGDADAVAKVKADATEALARRCRIYPDLPAYEDMIKRHPGIVDSVAGAAARLATAREEREAGK